MKIIEISSQSLFSRPTEVCQVWSEEDGERREGCERLYLTLSMYSINFTKKERVENAWKTSINTKTNEKPLSMIFDLL